MARTMVWVYDSNAQILSVSANCADYAKYGMLSFALTRYKDPTTYEEFLKVQSLYNGEDNGSIQTSLENLNRDLEKLKKYGVAFSNVQLGALKVEIDKVYLELDVVPVQTTNNSISTEDLPSIVEIIADYIAESDLDPEAKNYYLTVKEFEELFEDLDVAPTIIRKVLMDHGYIEGSKGRTAILKKVNGKPVRMVALVAEKFKKPAGEDD